MAYKRIRMKNTYEIARRWHAGHNISDISRTLGYAHKTVRKTIRRVEACGINREEPLPDLASLETLLRDNQNQRSSRQNKTTDILLPYKEELKALITHPQTPLKPKFAFEVICQRHELGGLVSYTSFKRFYRTHCDPPKRVSTCRIETAPGDLIQIDYAKMGLLFDHALNRRRALYAFIGTLAHSRHKFVEFTFKQDQCSFTASHVHMFESFGGVPARIALDNLKAGVIKPDLYDPEINRTYQEMADFYGCFLDPCRVAKPKDKGKVERDVQTIRQQFYKLLALHPDADMRTLNREITLWLKNEYGQKPHGTTGFKPYPLFQQAELPALKPLPVGVFEIATWKQARVHPDHYIQFGKQFFSVPHTIKVERVWIKATDKVLTVYDNNQNMIKQHLITKATRHTDWNDFPDNVQAVLGGDAQSRLLAKAARIGPNFRKLIKRLFIQHAFINLRRAQGLIRLTEDYAKDELEKAATYMLSKNIHPSPKTMKQLLEHYAKDEEGKYGATEEETPAIGEETRSFIRSADYFINP